MRTVHVMVSGLVLTLVAVTLSGCGSAPDAEAKETGETSGGITPQAFADGVHAVMMADRAVYAQKVVNRLKEQKSPVHPDEYWADTENTIPLPAQMFRMGAEKVDEKGDAGFSYGLKSQWPLNPQNKAETDVEIEGLKYVADNPGENFYGEEELGGQKYFTAVYADKAVAKACYDCHNNHENRGDDYPEFDMDDVMGGVVVRVPID